jgi:hypothetical protein
MLVQGRWSSSTETRLLYDTAILKGFDIIWTVHRDKFV